MSKNRSVSQDKSSDISDYDFVCELGQLFTGIVVSKKETKQLIDGDVSFLFLHSSEEPQDDNNTDIEFEMWCGNGIPTDNKKPLPH